MFQIDLCFVCGDGCEACGELVVDAEEVGFEVERCDVLFVGVIECECVYE